MTTSGTVTPAFAGGNVVVTYDPPNSAPFERTVQTDQNGNWSDSFVPGTATGQSNPDGTWTIQARYAGDATRRQSSSSTCTVEVVDS
jgi:hypothetical protein